MSYQDIDAVEVHALLGRDDLVVIDVRDAHAQARGRLPHAMPPSDEVIDALISRRHQPLSVLVYCYHGHSSRDLCAFLTRIGLRRVYNLAGGWAAWERHQSSCDIALPA
ncbi:rhodanese-like domain-containing protein [Acidihalobacter prosperus]|uniref:Rhodanese-like domain-containing protein n=1 Tax=Acidihalobacter prosperus TaxID=160660 RepID=A0A1A6C7P6_9GAMM|nr:rhodanese-like domain-containing protein [Acidihalobacter prosperus]OBS10569.1 rhodanese-like domain-containing protein [Acidihalobacter prosperus]